MLAPCDMSSNRAFRWLAAAGVTALFGSLHAFQRPFREFPGMEYNDFPRAPRLSRAD